MNAERAVIRSEAGVEIAMAEWKSFLAAFSWQHRDSLVTIEIATPAGRVIEVEQRRLKAIWSDAAGSERRIYVQVHNDSDGDITCTIDEAQQVEVEKDGEQEKGLEILSADGRVTRIEFRGAVGSEAAA